MNNGLKDDIVKLQVIKLDQEGKTQQEIGEIVGVPKSTIGDFLRRETFTSFWNSYEVVLTIPEVSVESVEKTEVVPVKILTSKTSEEGCTHLTIPDTQCKPNIDLSYLSFIGKYIVDRKPDVIIHIGDHADMPSLSSYDRGKKAAEGKRVYKDIESAILGMNKLLQPIKDYQDWELEEYGEVRYKPRMVLTLGNHEERIKRHINANPELEGWLSYDNLKYKEMGWEVYDFLQPVIINGITYVHFMANPMSGKPYGGMAMNVLKNVGESFIMGHKQTLDVATRFLPSSGKQQWAIIAGSCYEHDEDYKGFQGNHHWRGVIVQHEVREGSFQPMFVDLGYLRKRYG
jgi:hypothetical protein